MAGLQRRVLEQASAVLAVGGAMVYSVCSLAPEEGPELIVDFIARHPNFQVDLTPPAKEPLGGILDDCGFMRTRPDRDETDGFFAVRLKRQR
jgi:16S rRNA (cytosine967-C5)-methyltransferase